MPVVLGHNHDAGDQRALDFEDVLFEERDEELMHRGLAAANARRLAPGVPTDDWEKHVKEAAAVQIIEGKLVERERGIVEAHAAEAPFAADAFMHWFDQLRTIGPGQNDPFFAWLASSASVEQLRWTIEQEAAAHAGFEDLAALTQLSMPARARAELARPHFDGDSRPHAQRLAELAEWLGVAHPARDLVVWEALALSNLQIALALNRRYAYHSLGALAAAELAAPVRSAKIQLALQRLRLASAQSYSPVAAGSSEPDPLHTWHTEVIHALVRDEPMVARYIAEGALMHLRGSARCLERYRQDLSLALD